MEATGRTWKMPSPACSKPLSSILIGFHWYLWTRFVLRLLAAFLVLSTTIVGRQAQPQIRVSDLEQKIAGLVNSQRQSNSLKPLAIDDRLSKVARDHSEDMIKRGFFDHVNPDRKR